MLDALTRKIRQLARDRTLARWLLLRLFRLTPGEPPFSPHRPPYLGGEGLISEQPSWRLGTCAGGPPAGPITLALAGRHITLHPGEEAALMAADFGDTETLLSLHRFAWIRPDSDPAWVTALWHAWVMAHGNARDSWAWHPYTAAERAIALLAYARRSGLPGPEADTAALLAEHGPAIAARLEYFGDHHTSNHLANNGRGLYLLGLALCLPRCTAMGRTILLAESQRILWPSGVLREGSSHYHLLLTRSYMSVFLAARHHGLTQDCDTFAAIVRRMAALVPIFTLPGGFPLVGDISPDIAPADLECLLPNGSWDNGWGAWLDGDERAALNHLCSQATPPDPAVLAADGWLRTDHGDWHGLWHAAPEGFSHMPGHGHQDTGAFTLHWRDQPVVVDPGRGAYGDSGDAAHYRDGAVHALLQVDETDPYPPNKPYYHNDFRRCVAGPPPRLQSLANGVTLRHHGYARLKNVGAVERQWRFQDRRVMVEDRVEGRGQHHLCRRLVTPLTAEILADGTVLLGGRFHVKADGGTPRLVPLRLWHAYGEGTPGTAVEFHHTTALPWTGTLSIDLVADRP